MRSFVVKFSQCHFFQVLMIVNAFCMSVPNVGFQNDESKSLAKAAHVVPVGRVENCKNSQNLIA